MWHAKSGSDSEEQYEEAHLDLSMSEEDKEAHQQDRKAAEEITAKIWTFCFTTKMILESEKLKDKFESGDIDKIGKAVQETLNWLDAVQQGDARGGKNEVEAKQRELEDVIHPIMQKVMRTFGNRCW